MHSSPAPSRWIICLPAAGSTLERLVLPGSALVARADPGSDRLIVDFEGNLYGAVNLRSYTERLISAAWRSRESAPTVARRWVGASEITAIGVLDLDADGSFSSQIDQRYAWTLAHWLNIDPSSEERWRAALPAALTWGRVEP